MKNTKFRTLQALKTWNRLAKKEHQCVDYDALKDECREKYAETAVRDIEMPAYMAKSGCTEVIDF